MAAVRVFESKRQMAQAAADQGAALIRSAIVNRGGARILVATGASQFEFLDGLASASAIDWNKVEMFPLDEYVGLPANHRAGLGKYLKQRLIDRTGIGRYHLLDGGGDVARTILEAGAALAAAPVDATFLGIGENGHLAFNDPPADFDAEAPYRLVHLDDASKRQQVGEGWFASVDEVPTQAISISIRQILKGREILCVVPDARKAAAVKACLQGPVSPMHPASILRSHAHTTLFLDAGSASLLDPSLYTKGAA